MKLVERDYLVLREIDRWRFALSRQVRLLCNFSSQRTCDRRLKVLIDSGYVERRYVLYGIPGLYLATHKGKALIGVSLKPDKIRVEQIVHDIATVDTAIYFHLKHGVAFGDMTGSKSLHQHDGFGVRKHQPDFIFTHRGKTHAIEVELALKAKQRMTKILQDNFKAYDYQRWIVPNGQVKIRRIIEDNSTSFPNIHVLSLEEVTGFVKQAGVAK